ncbi:MAG: hypothetical protein J6Z25_02525 [Opitutales bacterium]|nr:hypothetical protein [Opitutales bacterium]
MKWWKYKGGMVAFIGLVLTGAFSLFEMRYAIAQQALQMKVLERELMGLQDIDQRLDVCLARWWHQQQALQGGASSRQILWMAPQDGLLPSVSLTYHR